MQSWLNTARVPWCVMSVEQSDTSYIHINPCFSRAFSWSLNDLQNQKFQRLWGISPVGVIHRINNAISRTETPQLVSTRIFHNRLQEWQNLRAIAWHEKTAGKQYRHTIFISEAECDSALKPAQTLTGLKIIA